MGKDKKNKNKNVADSGDDNRADQLQAVADFTRQLGKNLGSNRIYGNLSKDQLSGYQGSRGLDKNPYINIGDIAHTTQSTSLDNTLGKDILTPEELKELAEDRKKHYGA
tara:strand:+ start:339 stop:665 length:327 start_codon:yes stop_codon:yes gene_type:complete